MFQFTREFIINDNIGKIGGKRFDLNAAKDTLFVDNMINIRKKDINSVSKYEYEAAVNEKVVIDGASFTAPAAGEVVRLVITLGQRGKTTATYNDTYPDHSRHFFYETTGVTSVADMFAGLVSSYKHEATLSDVKFLILSANGAELTIDTPDCYTIVKEVRLVKLPVADPTSKIGALLTGYEDWDPIVVWTRKEGTTDEVTFTAGTEGNGNTVQILKNMRLLTDANLNPYGMNMDERPMPKGKYDQYTVELVTERRHIGHDVMGSVGTSLTTVVFYVLADATCADKDTSADFEEVLAQLHEIEEVKKLNPENPVGEAAMPKRVLAHTSDLDKEEEGSGSAE